MVIARRLQQAAGAYMAANPTGVDDTETIRAALAGRLILAPGNYVYKGTGEDVNDPYLVGSGYELTTITLPAGVHLINSTKQWGTARIEGVKVVGGAGVLRNTFAGTMVATHYIVRECLFVDFTGDCISHNSPDMPYWIVENNIFWPASEAKSICIALPGGVDRSQIRGNKFLTYAVAIKIGPGNANLVINENDFIHFMAGTNRTAIWLVPATPTTPNDHNGSGTIITHNKFGNENIDATDFRVLVADEGAGTTYGERLPSTAASTGRITGVQLTQNTIFGSTGKNPPALVTRTNDIKNFIFWRNQYGGTPPASILKFDQVPAPANDTASVVGPEISTYSWAYKAQGVSPATPNVKIVDDTGFLTA